MKIILFFISCLLIYDTMMIFDFDPGSDVRKWSVVDDVVMGGRSDGQFSVNDEGNGLFQGKVSLENNGGFSSIRYRFNTQKVEAYSKVVLRLKGDGKKYQFRVKSERYDRHSYIAYFQTTGDWQIVEIPLADMYPAFRGRKLNIADYPGLVMSEVAILISNKRAEVFQLEIDYIALQ